MHSSSKIPSDQVFRLGTQLDVLREIERLPPVDNLAVCIMCILSTEGGPSNLTFEHDRTQTPPITVLSIAMTTEDFWGYVIRSTDSRIGHDSPGFSPVIDDTSIADCQVDLVQVYRVSVGRSTRLSLEKLLVVGVVMKLVKAGRQTKVGELDVSTTVQQDVVGFDVTMRSGQLATCFAWTMRRGAVGSLTDG